MKVKAVKVPLYPKISKVDQNLSVHSSIFCFTSVAILCYIYSSMYNTGILQRRLV